MAGQSKRIKGANVDLFEKKKKNRNTTFLIFKDC